MLRGLPQLTISPTHNSSPNDLTLATSLSRHTCRLRALSSPRSPSLIGWGVAGAPPRITIHRFVRSVAGATPQGARCVELRLEPQLEAARSLTSHCSPRLASLASLASPRLPSTRLARLALLALTSASCSTRLASLASPRLFTRSPRLLARLTSSLASPPCAPRPPRHSPPRPSPHLNSLS